MDNTEEKRPVAKYEPGELERTRRNIGKIDKEEALKMMKTLGGEIGVEKSAPINPDSMPKRRRVVVDGPQGDPRYNRDVSQIKEPKSVPVKKNKFYNLPVLDSQTKSYMKEILTEYHIRPKMNIFTAFINWALNRHDPVSSDFVNNQLRQYVVNVVKYIKTVKKIIDSAPDEYKKQIKNNKDIHFRTLKVFYVADEELILKLYQYVQKHSSETTIKSLAALMKELFSFLYAIFFLGDDKLNTIILQFCNNIKNKTTLTQEALQRYLQDARALSFYIFSQVYKGLYPVLMRLCSTDIALYPLFYTHESPNILKFLDMNKFDVLLPPKTSKKASAKPVEKHVTVEEEFEEYEHKSRIELLDKGITILDIMFPEAGWRNLQSMPDMYPYFNPLFNFPEGFANMSSGNPMMITAILIRILDDFFTGCRYITFSLDEALQQRLGSSDIQAVIDNWGSYFTILFERNYLKSLREIANNVEANMDYTESQFGGRALSNLFWYAKNQFLPLLKFDLKFLDKPKAENMMLPIYKQVPALRRTFEEIIKRAEKIHASSPQTAQEDSSIGALKLWTHYKFPMPNHISRRLDVLLGGKDSPNANKLNLLKYTSCVLSVLDWWMNDKTSPAYSCSAVCPYRKDSEGHPLFFVEDMENVDALFAQNLKKGH